MATVSVFVCSLSKNCRQQTVTVKEFDCDRDRERVCSFLYPSSSGLPIGKLFSILLLLNFVSLYLLGFFSPLFTSSLWFFKMASASNNVEMSDAYDIGQKRPFPDPNHVSPSRSFKDALMTPVSVSANIPPVIIKFFEKKLLSPLLFVCRLG